MIGKVDIDYSSLLSQNYGEKINELVDAVNTIQKEREAERFEIQEWIGILEALRKSVDVHEKQIDELQLAKDVMFNRIDMLNNAICDIRNHIADTSKNAQDRMIGCTTLDIPESYKNDQLTLATLDYSKKLEKENIALSGELDRPKRRHYATDSTF